MRCLPLLLAGSLCLLTACGEDAEERPPKPPLDDTGPEGDTDTDADTDTHTDTDADADTDADTDTVEPPFDASSGGSGGSDHPSGSSVQIGGVSTMLLAPSGVSSRSTVPLLMVISGTEGAQGMMSNMTQVAPYFGLGDALIVVLDGRSASAVDGASVLDGLRALYDVDNDRTWLLSESAGTRAGLQLAFDERPSWFAAYWANDVNAQDTPTIHADQLGFAPWGNVGPGGDWPDADAIVDGMRAAGWQLPADAPYSGPGSDTHGSTDQFLEAVDFFAGKER